MSDGKQRQQSLLQQQTALAIFGELALRSNDLDEILTKACRLVGHALGTDLAKVMQLQDDGKTLLVRAGVGWKPGVVGVMTICASDDTSEGVALATGKPMISPDIAQETRFRYPAFLTDNHVKAVANVIIIGGQGRPPFGILQIDSREPRRFTEDDIDFLRGYANLLAAAVDRLRVLADIKRAEQALLRSNEALEARVAERTRQLTEANARLTAEALERERIEDALRQSQKMEALGQLTGGIAHDFNNLLTGITGSLELIQSRVAQGRTADMGRYIEAATTSAHRGTALIQRLLAFSRRQTLDPKPTDATELVSGMVELFRRTVGPSIQVDTSFVDGLWPALCDPNQLAGAVLNLVINARDAMPGGGHLLIETSNTVLRDRRGANREWPRQDVPPGEYVALTIADDGAGMAPDVVARAFDPFFTTKPSGQGTGLGLSMVHGFVQQSGGHVRLRTEQGEGTTVAIYLPRHLEAAVDAKDAREATNLASAAANSVVLVVEDEEAVRMVVRDVLSDIGYKVLEAENGRSGLDIANSGVPIDLLLTDVGLPGGMNGRQLADAARRDRPNLKMLFITGYADNVAVGNGQMNLGMQVLTKPFALAALADRVRAIIND